MDPSQVKIPPLKDLTIDNITDNTHLINSSCENPRFRYLMERLVTHLHDFARETRLSTDEWREGIEFLTATGQMCSDVRQEFILLSDVLGLSLLVDSIDHPKPPASTDGTVLGPFHTLDAESLPSGAIVSNDKNGTPLLTICTVKDVHGKPIPDVKIDVWETDSEGFYDVQREGRTEPDGRAVLWTNADGEFHFKAIVPVSYPIPHDGPVGKLLKSLRRHPWRPAHMHFMFAKEGYDPLITSLYMRGDPYEQSDAVFGVKESLIVDLSTADETLAKKYEVEKGCKVLKRDFVIVTEQETRELRDRLAMEAMKTQGRKMKLWHGLPVPDVD